jgi:tellurite resistance protein
MKDDLKEVVDFAIALANAGGAALEDGKISLSDLGILVTRGPELVSKGVAAIEGAENLKIADLMNSDERAELVARVKSGLDLPQDATEERIEAFIEAVAGVFSFIATFGKN